MSAVTSAGCTPVSVEERLARAGLTRLLEPGDSLGALAVHCWGAPRALRMLTGAEDPSPSELQDLALSAAQTGHRLTPALWSSSLERWASRRRDLHPERDLETLHRLGGGLITPQDPAWPEGLSALGLQAPLALWWRGRGALTALEGSLAVVGSREATSYGQQATHELAGPLAARGVLILSGGAYGIDAAAHRSALRSSTQGTATVAVMAGGLDRFYPAGNEALLREVMDRGLLFSELPPGSNPTRYRFLSRNRIIAGLGAAVLVVEARWRSGAQNTAGHALGIGRPVGVVPGPITSAASAGCHRLLRETPAVVVTSADEAAELLPAGAGTPGAGDARSAGVPGSPHRATEADRVHDHLTVEELLVFDALPVRSPALVDRLCSVAGLGTGTVLGVLQRLQRQGLAEQQGSGWRRGKQAR